MQGTLSALKQEGVAATAAFYFKRSEHYNTEAAGAKMWFPKKKRKKIT